MKVWFDTEFQDYGDRVELLSFGAVREDGEEFYAENGDARLDTTEPWVQANVIPSFTGPVWPKALITQRFVEFCGPRVELWAYYAGYDWWLLAQMCGGFMKMPSDMQYCGDIKALSVLLNRHALPKQPKHEEHHALYDARWNRLAWNYVMNIPS